MSRDDAVKFAVASGAEVNDNGVWRFDIDDLERFAALVAAHEREECARVCEQLDGAWDQDGGCIKCAAEIRARGES